MPSVPKTSRVLPEKNSLRVERPHGIARYREIPGVVTPKAVTRSGAERNSGDSHPQPQAAAVDGESEARTAERQRIGAILNHPEAQGREQLARYLALRTGMSPAEAAEVLTAASPKKPAPVASIDQATTLFQLAGWPELEAREAAYLAIQSGTTIEGVRAALQSSLKRVQ
jgi:hypothetical protein